MMEDNRKTFMIEDAQIIFRNFSGAATPFKPEGGSRTFAVVLDKEAADKLALDGWNVKCKPPQEEGDDEFCYIEVTVGYKVRPPKIVVITDTSRTALTEENVGMLDWADIRNADLIAREYQWEVGGKTGIKAYLQSLFVTIEEDALERKYAINQEE
jgi:hypothetical protein